MKWILVWWMIHPGHSQCIHLEKYQDVHACENRQNDLLAAGARARCSRL